MDKVVQQDVANEEHSASASEEMNGQADRMKEFAGELIALVGSHKEQHVFGYRRVAGSRQVSAENRCKLGKVANV
jgi:hypothetical protein